LIPMGFRISLILISGILLGCASSPYPHIDFKGWDRTETCCLASGKKMAVASGGTHASQAALEISQMGGTLADAAVAAAFTLAVERPQSLGLGGGGFFLYSQPGKKRNDVFVDFREVAPGVATAKMFRDSQDQVIPLQSRLGAKAVATPGFVPGMLLIHKKWGKLPWAKLLQPAIRLARQGFRVYPSLARRIDEEKKALLEDSYTKSLISINGELLKKGDWIRQLDLAQTLERIAENPQREMRSGITAQKIAAFMKTRGGLISQKDLLRYQAVIRKPLEFQWNGKTLLLAPPPSAGGVVVIEMLNMLARDALDRMEPSEYVHLLSESMRRAYADRSQAIGDPDFHKFSIEPLLSYSRAEKLRASITSGQATPSKAIRPISSEDLKENHTTQLSLMDEAGNAIAMTLSLNEFFGCRLAVPETGIFLNNQMDDFSSKPGEPNVFGLLGAEANSIAPFKRPVSSMTPTIILDRGRPVLAIGAAGGSKISTHVTQVFLNLFLRTPDDLRKAVFSPRFHHQWLPDQITLENGFSEKMIRTLKTMGHSLEISDRTALVQTVWRNPEGSFVAVFDPRDEGGAEAQ